ncbi:MAG: hypothetical protein HOP30_17570 [Cyclobacteriaceae bacterium]|nr:hypothetical protein [Cyclobacteriaceae bacterium]
MKRKSLLLVIACYLLMSFTLTGDNWNVLLPGNELIYTITYGQEDYKYSVKVEKQKEIYSFDYSIKGGSKILSGIYQCEANPNYEYYETSLAIPGSSIEGSFDPYILLGKDLASKLGKMKWNTETTIVIEGKTYTLTVNGVDSFSYATQTDREYVDALYCSLSDGGKNGSLVIGTEKNNQVIFQLYMPNQFLMQLDSVNYR